MTKNRSVFQCLSLIGNTVHLAISRPAFKRSQLTEKKIQFSKFANSQSNSNAIAAIVFNETLTKAHGLNDFTSLYFYIF